MGEPARVETVHEASVACTFDVLAWEIELASARCIFLDTILGEVMANLPPELRGRLVEGMHAVDLVSQQLTNLSSFARGMSTAVPANISAPVDGALGAITLGALADRMFSALGGEETATDADEDPGDLDLF